MNPDLIVFDVNKTLINENSWYQLNMALGVTPEEDAELMRLAEQGRITDAEGQQRLLALYRQRGDVSRRNIMRVLGEHTYLPYARQVVRELGARDFATAIISGAMDVLVESVANDLKIATWRASNRFVFDENDQLIDIVSPRRDDDDKLRQLQELIAERGIALHDCLVIGDGASDVPLFQATGNGVTFTDSPVAASARWVVDDLRGVLEVVNKSLAK